MLGTATKLKTARNINLSGEVSGSGSFDGSGNLNINTETPVKTATVTTTKDGINFTLVFKRTGKLVTINVKAFIPSNVEIAATYIALENLMPSWAKTSDNTIVTLDSSIAAGGYNYGEGGVSFSDVMRFSLTRGSNTDYRFMFLYAQGTTYSFPDGHTLTTNLSYIVS